MQLGKFICDCKHPLPISCLHIRQPAVCWLHVGLGVVQLYMLWATCI